jgi:hypothetical protein
MGYSITSKAVFSQRAYLDRILAEVSNEVSWVSSNPKLFSYRLFNAFKAAEELNIEPYCQLKKNWRITYDRGTVTVERIKRTILEAYKQAEDVYDVIDYVLSHENIKYPVSFPNLSSDIETLRTMYQWATKQGLYVIKDDKGLIITDTESSITWKPE